MKLEALGKLHPHAVMGDHRAVGTDALLKRNGPDNLRLDMKLS